MPSEQPPTRVEEAARALDKVIWLTDDVPHEVLVPARELHEALLNEPDKPALAQPQPREGSYNEQADRVFSEQPRGEGDDLASRLEEKSNVEEGLRPARPTNLPGPDLYHLGRAEAFAEAAQLARASTHPEQSARVDLEWAFRLMRDCLQAGKEPEDDEQDRLDDIADAMIRPAQTEQPREGARVEVLHPDSTYGRARNRMERESIPTGMEPAQPQPRGEGEWRSDEEAQALIDAIKGEPAPEGEGEAS